LLYLILDIIIYGKKEEKELGYKETPVFKG